MFLIVMLSFAIISEVSAAALDDAEPEESGLKVPIESEGTSCERLVDVPGEHSMDDIHSHNDQTSFGCAPLERENKNLYELKPAAHEAEINNAIEGEKMNNSPIIDLNVSHSGFDENIPHIKEKTNDIMSVLIGLDNICVAFKNSRNNTHNILKEFNGVLPQELSKDIVFDDNFTSQNNPAGKRSSLSQFGGVLPFKNITHNDFLPLENISLAKSGLPEVENALSNGVSTHFPNICIFPFRFDNFLPEINKTRTNTFPLKTRLNLSEMPDGKSMASKMYLM